MHPEMERDGLREVGTQIDDGPFVAMVLDPETNRILRSVQFERRGSVDDIQPPSPEDNLFEDGDGKPL